ncbi:hypothetical protein BC826DRAFT_1169060 [Russula brevipes]|nr:hypothetical protein BC826DRAFT_1169060 [Russula brevipes]
MDWLDPTVNVLLNFSETIGGAVSMAYPPAALIITGINSLLSAVQAASASQDAMFALFERIENFFKRLETYIGLPRTAGMMEIIVKVMAEVLIILGLATREIKQGKTQRVLKKLIGRSDIEDALQRLDNLMQEEGRMAAVQGLKATQGVDERVAGIRNDVQGVGDRVNDVIDGGERLRGELQLVVNDGNNCGRTLKDGSLLRIHPQITTSQVVLNTKAPPHGSQMAGPSRIGRNLALYCGFTENQAPERVCSPLQSSRTSMPFVPLAPGRLTWRTSFSISKTLGNKISGPYSLLSSSSSAINLRHSTTCFLSFILITMMVHSNLILLHSYSASETCLESKMKPRFILSSMRSMNVLTLLGCHPRANGCLGS